MLVAGFWCALIEIKTFFAWVFIFQHVIKITWTCWANAVYAFWKTHKCNQIPNWMRRVIQLAFNNVDKKWKLVETVYIGNPQSCLETVPIHTRTQSLATLKLPWVTAPDWLLLYIALSQSDSRNVIKWQKHDQHE